MKAISTCLLITSLTCATFSSYCQVARFIRILTKENKEYIQVFERERNLSEKLIYSIDDPQLIEKIKKEHPGEDLRKVKLSDAEITKIMRARYEKDRPYTVALWKENEERIKTAVVNSAIREHTDEDWTKKHFSPANFIVTTETYISIPSTQSEYINVFKENDDASFKSTLYLYNNLVTNKEKNFYFTNSATNLIQSISQKGKNAITIIGHNENGHLFFPDGSSIAFSQIDKVARKFNRIIVYLSCNAASHTTNPAVNYFLNYREALAINKFIQRQLNLLEMDLSQKQVIEKINGMLDIYKDFVDRKVKLKVIAYSSVAAGSLYGLYKIEQDK